MLLEVIDPRRAAPAELAALHRLAADVEAERYPDDPPYPYDEFVADVQCEPAYVRSRWAVAWDGDRRRVLGMAQLRMRELPESAELGRLAVLVAADVRRRGLGTRLLAMAVDEARVGGRRLLQGAAPAGSPGQVFAEAAGARLGRVDHVNRLDVAGVDGDLLERWVADAAVRAPGYVLRHWHASCPDDLLEGFAAARSIMGTAPADDLTQPEVVVSPAQVREEERADVEAGYASEVVAAVAPDGSVAGYTHLVIGEHRPQMAWQGDTGVEPAHRGRGIGRWLKAAMLLHLRAEHPEVRTIDTGNAGSNAPMLAINHALGFRLIEELWTFEAETDVVAEVVSARTMEVGR